VQLPLIEALECLHAALRIKLSVRPSNDSLLIATYNAPRCLQLILIICMPLPTLPKRGRS